jgi:hypothetical protein
MEVPLLGQGNDLEPEDKAEEPVYTAAKTAFLIYINDDSSVVVNPDINMPIVTEREPTPDEIWIAVATIKRDIEREQTALLTAQHTVNAQMQIAQQLQERQLNAQVMAQMGKAR